VAILEKNYPLAWATVRDALRRFAGTSVEHLAGVLLLLGIRSAADEAAAARAAGNAQSLRAALDAAEDLAELGRSSTQNFLAETGTDAEPRAAAEREQWQAEWARLHAADTADIWESAARLWRDTDAPGDADTYCLWRAANALVTTTAPATRDRRTRLTALLRDAHRGAAAMGDVPLLREIDGLAAAARVDLAEPPPDEAVAPAQRNGPHGLTPRELDVLRLLAEGLTNAQIARRLFISANTAGVHVGRIFAKLAVTNRTAAARSARELGLLSETAGQA
jgi:DNA-binding CsgD family transcriptional regulator